MSTLSQWLAQHELEQSLHHARASRPARSAHGNGQSPRVPYHHHRDPSTCPRPSNAFPSAGWRKHARIRQALAEPVAKLHHQTNPPGLTLQPLEHFLPVQPLPAPVHRAFGAELSRQILPSASVVRQPEPSGQCLALALVRAGTAAPGGPGRIGNPCPTPFEQAITSIRNDAMLLTPIHSPVWG